MKKSLKDIVAFGAEHSSLKKVVKKPAQQMQLEINPYPIPEQVFFIRSDQYSFAKQGMPSAWPVPGCKSSNPKVNPANMAKTGKRKDIICPEMTRLSLACFSMKRQSTNDSSFYAAI